MSTPADPLLWPHTTTVDDGAWSVAGLPLMQVAAEFGTPTFVLDVATLQSRARRYRRAFETAFGPDTGVYYASKAFSSIAVLRWLNAEGLRVDVASEGELRTALLAGVPPAQIGLHGNNKSDAELQLAVGSGVGRIIVDSAAEIERVARVAGDSGIRQNVLLRVTPGVHAGGHDSIATAHEDQKFGLSIATGAALSALADMASRPELNLRGLHCHIGSQILAPDAFSTAAMALLDLRAQLADRHAVVLAELDLGGGFGVAYLPGEDELDIEATAAQLATTLHAAVAADGLPAPEFSFEPGRSIIAPAMLTLYRVGTCKPVTVAPGQQRLYVSVDGGMSDNLRTALYQADYHAQVVNREVPGPSVPARVVGKHCESGDIVVRDVDLPQQIEAGDLLAVPVTGAYGRSMASNYNLVPRPGVVAVADSRACEIVRRETVEDILVLDLGATVPADLQAEPGRAD